MTKWVGWRQSKNIELAVFVVTAWHPMRNTRHCQWYTVERMWRTNFYEHVMKEAEIIGEIVRQELFMSPLTPLQKFDFQTATHCRHCNTPVSPTNQKVRHHCHVSGRYLFPCCNNFNLQLERIKRGRKKAGENVTTERICGAESRWDVCGYLMIPSCRKGIQKHFVKKELQHQHFLSASKLWRCSVVSFLAQAQCTHAKICDKSPV